MRAVITGGAGFLGSHLSDLMLDKGWEILCLDNLVTGSDSNVAHLLPHPKFRFARQDVSRYIDVPGPVDAVLHFASPASPPDYLKLPIQTLKVGSLGTHNTLGLALAKKAKYFLASTSECYGDPDVSPQPETYWGHVNTIGPRGVYDEAEALRRGADDGLSPRPRRGHAHRAHLQYLRAAHAPQRRPRAARIFVHQGLTGEPHHRIRQRQADAQLLLRFRFNRWNLPPDEVRRA